MLKEDIDNKNVYSIEVKSTKDVIMVNDLLEKFKVDSHSIYEKLSKRIKEININLTYEAKNGSKIKNWDNRSIGVHISQDRVLVRFFYDLTRGRSVDIEAHVADKYKVYNFNDEKRPESIEKNVEVGDIYSVRFPGVTVDLLKGENIDEVDIMSICYFVAKEFKQKHTGFFGMAKGFYDELSVLWRIQSDIGCILSVLDDKRSKYLMDVCIEEAAEMNIVNKNSVIVCFKKKKEFIEFMAYNIESVGKNVTYFSFTGYIENTWIRNDEKSHEEDNYRHYLKINAHKGVSKTTLKEFNKFIGQHLYNGDKVEEYTQEEWRNFCMLNKTEIDNITNNSKEIVFKELSDNYRRIKQIQY